jgi:hypothetical protein
MLAFTPKNAVVIAVLQLTIIVMGVLGAGIVHKLDHQHLLLTTRVMLENGYWLLFVPLGWIAVALKIRNSTEMSDRKKQWAFAAGVLFLVLLLAGAGDAVFRPLLTHQSCFLIGAPGSGEPGLELRAESP